MKVVGSFQTLFGYQAWLYQIVGCQAGVLSLSCSKLRHHLSCEVAQPEKRIIVVFRFESFLGVLCIPSSHCSWIFWRPWGQESDNFGE